MNDGGEKRKRQLAFELQNSYLQPIFANHGKGIYHSVQQTFRGAGTRDEPFLLCSFGMIQIRISDRRSLNWIMVDQNNEPEWIHQFI